MNMARIQKPNAGLSSKCRSRTVMRCLNVSTDFQPILLIQRRGSRRIAAMDRKGNLILKNLLPIVIQPGNFTRLEVGKARAKSGGIRFLLAASGLRITEYRRGISASFS